jgi:thioredoxin-related protein
LYLTILVVCRKNLNQSDHTDYKIITIEGEEKVILVESPDCYQCFEIQYKLGG